MLLFALIINMAIKFCLEVFIRPILFLKTVFFRILCLERKTFLFLLLWETERPAQFSQEMKETNFTCTYKCVTLENCYTNDKSLMAAFVS